MSPLSPLARSLYALAALVAVVAEPPIETTYISFPPGSLCTAMTMERYKGDDLNTITVTFKLESNGKPLEILRYIDNHCEAFNRTLGSQYVKACNGYQKPSAPHWFPPKIEEFDNIFSPIYASCEDNLECEPIIFEVTQKCVILLHT